MIDTYCITLDQTPERRDAAVREFAKHNLPVKMVQGVHGTTWGLRTTKPYNKDRTPEQGDHFCSPGHVGLCLSHWMIWNYLKITGTSQAIVFEDDAILCDNFHEEFWKSYNALPQDWDLVYLGQCCTNGRSNIRVNDRVCEIKYPLCTHALLIRDTALSVLLEHGATSYAPVDIMLFYHVLPKLRVYSFVPQLVDQHTLRGDWKRSILT